MLVSLTATSIHSSSHTFEAIRRVNTASYSSAAGSIYQVKTYVPGIIWAIQQKNKTKKKQQSVRVRSHKPMWGSINSGY